jgi:hypothetical protein
MSSYRSKYTKYFHKYKDLAKAFRFLKWAFKNTTINGQTYEFPVPKCGPQQIVISDGVNPVNPTSVTVVGNVVTAQVPACPPAVTRSTATLMKTGQTTSYRTGDDGDIEAGRATDFLTLDSAPVHNDGSATINTTTNRFTDVLGGQTYTDNIVLDWSTWNGSTLLGWYKVGGASSTWNNAIDGALAISIGVFTSGWRLPNDLEFHSIVNRGATTPINYTPFNLSAITVYWTSTTNIQDVNAAYAFSRNSGNFVTNPKSSSFQWIPVRTFSLSTSNILS